MRVLESIAVTAACLALAIGPRASAQTSENAPDSTRLRATRIFVGATAGTGLGLLGGIHFGESLGWGGGDDPGLLSALLFGAIGTVAGNTLGAKIFEPRLPFERAVASGVLGVVGGLLVIAGLNELIDEEFDVSPAVPLISFSLASGAFATLLSYAAQR